MFSGCRGRCQGALPHTADRAACTLLTLMGSLPKQIWRIDGRKPPMLPMPMLPPPLPKGRQHQSPADWKLAGTRCLSHGLCCQAGPPLTPLTMRRTALLLPSPLMPTRQPPALLTPLLFRLAPLEVSRQAAVGSSHVRGMAALTGCNGELAAGTAAEAERLRGKPMASLRERRFEDFVFFRPKRPVPPVPDVTYSAPQSRVRLSRL